MGDKGYVLAHVLEVLVPGCGPGAELSCEVAIGGAKVRCPVPSTLRGENVALSTGGHHEATVQIQAYDPERRCAGRVVVPTATLAPLEVWSVWYAIDEVDSAHGPTHTPMDETGKMHLLLQHVPSEAAAQESPRAREVRGQHFLLRALQALNSSLEARTSASDQGPDCASASLLDDDRQQQLRSALLRGDPAAPAAAPATAAGASPLGARRAGDAAPAAAAQQRQQPGHARSGRVPIAASALAVRRPPGRVGGPGAARTQARSPTGSNRAAAAPQEGPPASFEPRARARAAAVAEKEVAARRDRDREGALHERVLALEEELRQSRQGAPAELVWEQEQQVAMLRDEVLRLQEGLADELQREHELTRAEARAADEARAEAQGCLGQLREREAEARLLREQAEESARHAAVLEGEVCATRAALERERARAEELEGQLRGRPEPEGEDGGGVGAVARALEEAQEAHQQLKEERRRAAGVEAALAEARRELEEAPAAREAEVRDLRLRCRELQGEAEDARSEALGSAELRATLEDRDNEIKLLMYRLQELSSQYTPVPGDHVDAILARWVNGYRPAVPFFRLNPGLYLFGRRQVLCKVSNDKPVFRIGGGFVSFDRFLELHASEELARLLSYEVDERTGEPLFAVAQRVHQGLQESGALDDVRGLRSRSPGRAPQGAWRSLSPVGTA